MFVMLRDSVWNAQEDVHTSGPSGRGAEVFTTTLSQIQFASGARRGVGRNVTLGLGTLSETGSSARSDSFHTSMVNRVQEKDSEKEEKAPMVTVLAL